MLLSAFTCVYQCPINITSYFRYGLLEKALRKAVPLVGRSWRKAIWVIDTLYWAAGWATIDIDLGGCWQNGRYRGWPETRQLIATHHWTPLTEKRGEKNVRYVDLFSFLYQVGKVYKHHHKNATRSRIYIGKFLLAIQDVFFYYLQHRVSSQPISFQNCVIDCSSQICFFNNTASGGFRYVVFLVFVFVTSAIYCCWFFSFSLPPSPQCLLR